MNQETILLELARMAVEGWEWLALVQNFLAVTTMRVKMHGSPITCKVGTGLGNMLWPCGYLEHIAVATIGVEVGGEKPKKAHGRRSWTRMFQRLRYFGDAAHRCIFEYAHLDSDSYHSEVHLIRREQ